MTNIASVVEIKKDPKTIWRVLTDFQRYSEWNSLYLRISGKFEVKKKLSLSVKLGDLGPILVKVKILKIDPFKEIRWVGNLITGAIFRGEHYIQIKPVQPGITAVVTGEQFSGFLDFILMPLIVEPRIKPAFEKFNRELKARCEAITVDEKNRN